MNYLDGLSGAEFFICWWAFTLCVLCVVPGFTITTDRSINDDMSAEFDKAMAKQTEAEKCT